MYYFGSRQLFHNILLPCTVSPSAIVDIRYPFRFFVIPFTSPHRLWLTLPQIFYSLCIEGKSWISNVNKCSRNCSQKIHGQWSVKLDHMHFFDSFQSCSFIAHHLQTSDFSATQLGRASVLSGPSCISSYLWLHFNSSALSILSPFLLSEFQKFVKSLVSWRNPFWSTVLPGSNYVLYIYFLCFI